MRQSPMHRSRRAQAVAARSSSGSPRPCSNQECRVQAILVCHTQEWLTAARFRWPTARWGRCPGLDLCPGRRLSRQALGRCRWAGRRLGLSHILALGPGAIRHSRRSDERARKARESCALLSSLLPTRARAPICTGVLESSTYAKPVKGEKEAPSQPVSPRLPLKQPQAALRWLQSRRYACARVRLTPQPAWW